MNDDVKKLLDTINAVITDPKYQPGYRGTTWCIVAAWDILTRLGYDTADLIDSIPVGVGQFYTTPDEMAQRAERMAMIKKYVEVPEHIAQDLANLGVGVLACSYHMQDKAGHDAIVAPGTFSQTEGCTVGQAGGRNGIFSRVHGFGSPNTLVTMPKFYILPKKV